MPVYDQGRQTIETDALNRKSAEPGRSLISIRDLIKIREQGGVSFELRVPAFELRTGEFVALVGTSGCGKSTLLDILALVLQPTSVGSFLLKEGEKAPPIDIKALWSAGDEEALARVRREQLGYVLQSGGLLPFLSVRRNIGLSQLLKQGTEQGVAALAAGMGLESLLNKKPRYLSGGQRQRVAILRAIAHRPAIVLADEPTAAVDSTRAHSILEDFRDMARAEGSAVIMVSHDLGLVDAFADRIYSYRLEAPSASATRATCVPGYENA